jgi:hypothetical protein
MTFEEASKWIASQDARIRALEAALREAIDYIELDSEHPDMRYSKALLTAPETFAVKVDPLPDETKAATSRDARSTEDADRPAPVQFPSKCCKCGKVEWYDKPQQGVYFCSYACT